MAVKYSVGDCKHELKEILETLYPEDHQHRAALTDFIQSISTKHTPQTWRSAAARSNFDVKANWLHKELSRSGDNIRNSERRCELYEQRRNLRNIQDITTLWHRCPERCAITGAYINYGLGETQTLLDQYFVVISGEPGISPSIERTDPNKGYTIDNIEIISSFENMGRNLGVNTGRLRQEREDLVVL